MVIQMVTVAIAAIALIVLAVITIRKRKKSRAQEISAAEILIKQKQLINAIDRKGKASADRRQLMLVVTWKEEKIRKYVFDPSQGVRIGRSREHNQICIPLETVSHSHCMIFSRGDMILVKDHNSANGTFIKRGLRTVRVNGCMACQENDTVIVGNVRFKIRSFYVEGTYL